MADAVPVPATEAFEDVYRTTYDRWVRVAALITASRPVAEEIVQEAFVQLYRNWEVVLQPVPWMRATVVNNCRSWQRRTILERRHATPAPLVATDRDGVAVREALAVLTPRQRAAVVLRYFEDLPEAGIAEVLGCRPGTVKSLLARAMDKLQEELGDD